MAVEECAFVILEDCRVSLRASLPVAAWVDVELRQNHQQTAGSNGRSSTHGELVLDAIDSQPGRLFLNVNDVPEFDGVITRKPSSEADLPKSRTDASLVMGLLRACRKLVSVTSLKVLSLEQDSSRVSLVFTIGFPYLSWTDTSKSILPDNMPSSSLPLQTLLSLVRSDWKFLEKFTRGMSELVTRNRVASKKESPSMFPTTFSLDQLYQRVRAESFVQQFETSFYSEDQAAHNATTQRTTATTNLMDLTTDILREKLAPFLDANAIRGLRSTCSNMYTCLESYVPGLCLQLYKHQMRSLTWMRQREAKDLTEMDLLTNETSGSFVNGDAHRTVTGGVSVRLARKYGTNVVRLNQLTGREFNSSAVQNLDRRVARGGLLCDDPGLGKTITILALILQTANSRPVCLPDSLITDDAADEELFQTYWKEHYIHPDIRRQPLLQVLNSFLRTYQIPKASPLIALRRKVDNDDYGPEFGAFVDDVLTCIRNTYQNSVADDISKGFVELVGNFKRSLCSKAKKSCSNASAKPNSPVAALITKRLHRKFLQSLEPSKGTLLVVPAVLLDHWEDQIRKHVDLNYLSRKQTLIFNFTGCMKSVSAASDLIFDFGTHAPILFLDRAGAKPLPSRKFLAAFQIVITTNQRFVNEWKNGSFQQEIRRENAEQSIPAYRLVDSAPTEACSLLKVYWYRMVIDEGHSMAKGQVSSSIQFASWVSSERRFCMTGTPTKQSCQLSELKALFGFLQHGFFCARNGGDAFWKRAIDQGWKHGYSSSFFRICSLLQMLMKRHTKFDIDELPPPIFTRVDIPMSSTEVNTYNTLVAGIQSNLILTSMKGRTSGRQDSLLHRNNSTHARSALINIRRVCVGWSRVIPTLDDKNWRETMILAELALDEDGIDHLRNYLHTAEDGGLGRCSCCNFDVSTLLIMNCCGSFVCTECMDASSNICLVCDAEFDVDMFQRFQPGFLLTWKSNIVSKSNSRRRRVAQPPAPVPSPNEGARNALSIRRQRARKFGDGHVCTFVEEESGGYSHDGRCVLCRVQHQSCNMLNDQKRCNTCGKRAQDVPEASTKAHYISNQLLSINQRWRSSGQNRPLKVIVFSQFREALNFVGDFLLRRFGAGCVAEYWGKYRRQELHKFVTSTDCFCMLLTKDGSEGLDLSFVTHIYLLEEIWDKALEDQVVARAWRMGAKGCAQVQTLIASNSIEAQIYTERASAEVALDSSLPNEASARDRDRTRTAECLKGLRFITDYHRLGGNKSETVAIDARVEAEVKRKLAEVTNPGTVGVAVADKGVKKRRKTVQFSV